ncbi:hypothetical protein BDBG_17332 [Blastomyces gilchristii SLH14081]|uniref:Uncharacterized protein n=2 Tax=Blastomyces TaxID=229219 RepID=A0A179USR4_BLAGS|nr:uncharacterized protein BDBG_17332 [Blastomyces gilchristii SLH14081]EGE83882.2 hypothetical protein BDDG_06827 [Blastomyces dermatitidis ATCC 18188]OAT10238.1 hypothetical protein BDBG_17332 [Blastomyces gilchristii SLH14081]
MESTNAFFLLRMKKAPIWHRGFLQEPQLRTPPSLCIRDTRCPPHLVPDVPLLGTAILNCRGRVTITTARQNVKSPRKPWKRAPGSPIFPTLVKVFSRTRTNPRKLSAHRKRPPTSPKCSLLI